jgi:hypothetical protein
MSQALRPGQNLCAALHTSCSLTYAFSFLERCRWQGDARECIEGAFCRVALYTLQQGQKRRRNKAWVAWVGHGHGLGIIQPCFLCSFGFQLSSPGPLCHRAHPTQGLPALSHLRSTLLLMLFLLQFRTHLIQAVAWQQTQLHLHALVHNVEISCLILQSFSATKLPAVVSMSS